MRATDRIFERFKAEAPGLVDRAIEGTLLSGLLDDASAAEPGSPIVSSVSSQFRQRGWLSSRQITALVRIVEQASIPRV